MEIAGNTKTEHVSYFRETIRRTSEYNSAIDIHLSDRPVGSEIGGDAVRVVFSEDPEAPPKIRASDPTRPSTSMALFVVAFLVEQLRYKSVSASLPHIKPTFEFESVSRENQYLRFLITGLAALTVITTALYGFSLVLVELRAHNAFKMFHVMPMQKSHYLVAFICSRIIILVIFCLLFIYGTNAIMDAGISTHPQDILLAGGLLLLGSAAFLGAGLALSATILNTSTASSLINLLNFLLIFLSDLFIPVSVMPELVQEVVRYSPVYMFVNVLRETLSPDMAITGLGVTLATLTVLLFASVAFAAATFKWEPR